MYLETFGVLQEPARNLKNCMRIGLGGANSLDKAGSLRSSFCCLLQSLQNQKVGNPPKYECWHRHALACFLASRSLRDTARNLALDLKQLALHP